MGDSFTEGTLGKTGLNVGRLGISGGYGASAEAIEMAFERGCNYLYHGSFRRKGMNNAIKNLCARGQRDKMIVIAQVYWRLGWLLNWSFEGFLKKTGLDYADVLLLGWHDSTPTKRILDACAKLKEQKKFRFLAISAHNRPAFPEFAKTGLYDIFHVRYNAAHPGAETDVFSKLPAEGRPGIVTYTTTRWGGLINPRKTPPGERTPSASDCYRFAMSNPAVNICMSGPKNLEETQEALSALDKGPLTPDEMAWMRRVGAHMRVK
jgi:aryl-alcohol dehydrogenase-like predicted oxidoreductase